MSKPRHLLIAVCMVAIVCLFPAQAFAYGWYDDSVDISKGTIRLSQSSFEYTGAPLEPAVTVTVDGETLDDWDYDVVYSNNTNAGTATVTVTADSYYYTGTLKKTFTISPKKVKSCFIEHAQYNGKVKEPPVYVATQVQSSYDGSYYEDYTKLKKGRDYTIKVSGGHKKVGKYTAAITFKGNFTGKLKKTFKILPKAPTIKKTKTLSTSQIKVTWSKVKGASGYKVYRWNSKKGKFTLYRTTKSRSCTISRASKYDRDVSFYIRAYKKVGKKNYLSEGSAYGSEYLKLSKPAFSLKRTDFGKFEVRFKASGNYQIQISSNKKFKNDYPEFSKEWKGYTSTLTCYNYTSGQKVYVRARGYYYKNGVLKVGPWSAVKGVTPY